MSKDTGGPAFPFEYHNQTSKHQEGFFDTGLLAPDAAQQFAGMSLRDYFAAKAMQGFLANPNQDYAPLTPTALKSVVEGAYEVADAMLAKREAE